MNTKGLSLLSALCLLLAGSLLCGTAQAADVITHYVYDSSSQVTRQWVETGGAVLSDRRTQYDEWGRPMRVRELATPGGDPDDAADRISETAWNMVGDVRLERRKYGETYASTYYGYDELNRRTSMTDPLEHTTNYLLDGRGNITGVRDPLGNWSFFEFDAAGKQILEQRCDGPYDVMLQIDSYYDSRGHKVGELQSDGQTSQILTQQRWQYDELDRLASQVQMADPDSTEETADPTVDRITDYTYVTGTQDLLTRTTYSGAFAAPQVTSFEYDDLGRPTKITDPNGNNDEYTYVPVGTHGEGMVASRKVTNPGLTDPSGVDISAQEFIYTYDWQFRKISELAIGKGSAPDWPTSYDYNDASRKSTVTNARGIATEYYSNAFGDQVKIVEDVGGLARTTEMEYDQLGRMKSQKITNTDSSVQTTTYAYDLADHRTNITFPGDKGYIYTYDDAGRMETRTDPRSQLTTYTHNWHGQVETKTCGSTQETFTYYATGWMKSAEVGSGGLNKSQFACDGFGQVTSVTQTIDGINKTTTCQYDPSGGRSQLVYPDGVGVTLTFEQDGLGQTTRIRRNDIELADHFYAGRNLTGRSVLTSRGIQLNLSVGLDAHRQQVQLTNWAWPSGDSSVVLDQTNYTYDLAGNRSSAAVVDGDKRLDPNIGYGYDRLDRLTSANYGSSQQELFHYDLLGNRDGTTGYTDRQGRQTSYTHNDLNQYLTISSGSQAPVYDDAGNLTQTENGYGLAYDYDNRLVKVYTDSNHNGQWDSGEPVLADYAYDALGHRIKETKGCQSVRCYYDGETVLAEYDAATGNLLRYHVGGPSYLDEHVLLHEQGQGGQPSRDYYYLLGPLYSVTGLVNASAAVVERYTYDAYGLPHQFGYGNFTSDDQVDLKDFLIFQKCYTGSSMTCNQFQRRCDYNGDDHVDLADYQAFAATLSGTVPAPISPYRFTGQKLDFQINDACGQPLLVLYHFKARAYDALNGRFAQRDPAEYRDSMDLYEYCRSRPTVCSDPTGEFTLVELLGVGAKRVTQILNAAEEARQVYGFVGDIVATGNIYSALMNLAMEAAKDKLGGAAFERALKGLRRVAQVAGEGIKLHKHHLIPMVMGGAKNQTLFGFPSKWHLGRWQKVLNEELEKLGIKLKASGGVGSSAKDWEELLKDAGNVEKVQQALLNAGARLDVEYFKATGKMLNLQENIVFNMVEKLLGL